MQDDEPKDSPEASDNCGCALIFTKPGRPGRVKTRLVGKISAQQAADLHLAFLGDLVERLSAGSFSLALAWALDEGEEIPSWPPPSAGSSVLLATRQQGDDLGERLWNALSHAAREHRWVAVVGSDHPTLTASAIEQAFERLAAGAQLVFGPATDGGYYLVAASRDALASGLLRRAFEDIPWSTGEVLATTLERCAELGFRPALLPMGSDVDTPEDVEILIRRLAAGEPPACPRTQRLLEAWGRLVPSQG